MKTLWTWNAPVTLGMLFLSSVSFAANLAPGFYRYQNSGVISVYSDLVAGTQGKDLGMFGVDEQKIVLSSQKLPNGQIQLVQSNGRAANTADLQFLGTTQTEAAAVLGISSAAFSQTVYLAHRGTSEIPVLKSSSLYPGNTLAAMNLSLQNGYQGFEFDVQLTQDGQFVVAHDQNLSISTNCSGNVSDKLLSELAACKVQFTGLIPEQTLLHSPADLPQSMPSLKEVLDTYLPDARVSKLVIDTKPGDLDAQVDAFHALLQNLSEDSQAKLIFLIRDLQIETRLKALGHTASLYALEGDKGWEPLQEAVDPAAHAISLSLGIGLGLAGQQGQSVLSLLMSLPEFMLQGTLHGWRGGSVDIASIQWLPATMQKYKDLETQLEARSIPVVGWTVNTGDKISWLRKATPHLPFLLSDLPYSEIAKLEVKELKDALPLILTQQ